MLICKQAFIFVLIVCCNFFSFLYLNDHLKIQFIEDPEEVVVSVKYILFSAKIIISCLKDFSNHNLFLLIWLITMQIKIVLLYFYINYESLELVNVLIVNLIAKLLIILGVGIVGFLKIYLLLKLLISIYFYDYIRYYAQWKDFQN